MARRKAVLSQGIETYVLREAPVFLQRYQDYAKHLLGRNNVFFYTFENMMNDPHAFLQCIENRGGISLPPALVDRMVRKDLARPKDEDVYAHKRVAKARDFEKKLSPHTILRLNDLFGEVLETFGYRS